MWGGGEGEKWSFRTAKEFCLFWHLGTPRLLRVSPFLSPGSVPLYHGTSCPSPTCTRQLPLPVQSVHPINTDPSETLAESALYFLLSLIVVELPSCWQLILGAFPNHGDTQANKGTVFAFSISSWNVATASSPLLSGQASVPALPRSGCIRPSCPKSPDILKRPPPLWAPLGPT